MRTCVCACVWTHVGSAQSADIDVVKTFETMGLKEDLLRGIYAYGVL
jgi:hypothetical protein